MRATTQPPQLQSSNEIVSPAIAIDVKLAGNRWPPPSARPAAGWLDEDADYRL